MKKVLYLGAWKAGMEKKGVCVKMEIFLCMRATKAQAGIHSHTV